MLMSNDNRLEVTFVSRSSNPEQKKGFKANYKFVQGTLASWLSIKCSRNMDNEYDDRVAAND